MGLTVVTHTRSLKSSTLARCIDSVAAALPPSCEHKVIELINPTATEFQKARYSAMQLGDIVVFVDDDDYISQDSLTLCLDALTNTSAGLAFTNEVIVDPDGSTRVNNRRINYDMICLTPQIIHHMSAYRTSSVSSDSYMLAEKYQCGIEWIMKCEAAYKHGAVYIPTNGYYWVQHALQHHRTLDWQTSFRRNTRLIGAEMRKWLDPAKMGPVPEWNSEAVCYL